MENLNALNFDLPSAWNWFLYIVALGISEVMHLADGFNMSTQTSQNPYAPPTSPIERRTTMSEGDGVGCAHLAASVEDHFGITLTEREQETVHTVGALVQVVHARLEAAQSARFPSLAAFKALRTLVQDVTGDSSFKVRPRDRVDELLDARQRGELWKLLPRLLGASPRSLRRSEALCVVLVFGAIAIIVSVLLLAAQVDLFLLPIALSAGLVACVCLEVITRQFRICPPRGWRTFGDITMRIVGATVATKRLHLRTQEAVMDELRPIIVDMCGVDANEVRLESRFLEDYDLR